MAVHRTAPICFKCGEPIEGIYNHRPGFVGDTFVRWDYAGHKCDTHKCIICGEKFKEDPIVCSKCGGITFEKIKHESPILKIIEK